MSSRSPATSDVPLPLRNWLRSQYPTLTLKQSWLHTILSSFDGPRSAADGKLIEYVHLALLDADLKDVAGKGVLQSDVINTSKETVVGSGVRGAVLVQIVGKLDIGVSAQAQLDVLEARRNARSTIAGRAIFLADSNAAVSDPNGALARRQDQHALTADEELEGGGRGDDDEEEEERDHHMDEFAAAEEAALLPATVFPRSMLQLELSDGFQVVVGFEHRRISALSMADTPLGAKLLLKDVRVKKGKLYLEPKTVILKGGRVAALEQDAEDRLIDRLRSKLGKAPLQRKKERRTERTLPAVSIAIQDEGSVRRSEMAAVVLATSRQRDEIDEIRQQQEQEQEQQQQHQGPPSSFDEAQFAEDEAMLAELQEEEARRRAAAAAAIATIQPLPQPPDTVPSRWPPDNEEGGRRLDRSLPLSRLPERKKLKQGGSSNGTPQLGMDISDDKYHHHHHHHHHHHQQQQDKNSEEEVEPAQVQEDVGASFLAGMTDDEADFIMMETNDSGNPIVLSDSD